MRQVLVFLAVVVTLAVSPAAPAAGLLAPTDETLPPLRITDHLVKVEIRDQVAITTITQKFRNDTSRRLEGRYVFPLPEQADLTNFEMSFNGKMVTGEVLPAAEARRIYESIVRQSRDPGLIEFIGHRLLQMRVFPIEPRSETTISLRYQQICRPISGMHGYHYPLRTGRSDGRAYGTVRFDVTLDTGSGLKNIWSPSHAVEIVRDGDHKAHIAHEANGASLEEDFLLLYDTDSSDLGLSVIAHQPTAGEPGHFVLLAAPRQLWSQEGRQPQDVVFVVDTSGSMAGDKIAQARQALTYCVEQLDEKDRFSVVRFSTGFDALFDPLETATRERRAEAARWIEGFHAAGGTNIGQTLQHVMTLRAGAEKGGRPFVVVFLTDGQGNREADEITSMVAGAATALGDDVRIFPFGVGHDVNTVLLDGLAAARQGRPTYVQPGENLELVLGDFFSVVSRPVLTRLKLTLPDIGATERFPAMLGDLYHGQQVLVTGQFTRPVTGPVKLTATRNGEPVEYVWPDVAFTNTPEADYVPSVWAGRKIAYLVDEIRRHGESPEMIKEVVELSRRYGIQTPYTSWLVAPEHRPVVLGRRPGPMGRNMPERDSAGMKKCATRRRIVGRSAPGAAASGPPVSMRPNDAALDDLALLSKGLDEESGESATALSRYNEALRTKSSVAEGRVDDRLLPRIRCAGRWYDRIGAFLVDERIDDKATVTVVQFASEAYFELLRKRPELKTVMSRGRNVAVMAADGQAVLVVDGEGVEKFTDEQREQLRLR